MKKHLIFAAFCAATLNAMAWSWTGTAPEAGSSYYLYTLKQNKFVNDADGLDAAPAVLWTIGGTPTSNYTMTSADGKQFAMYRTGGITSRVYHVETSATGKSGSDINMSSDWNDGAKAYTLYRQDKNTNWGVDRNVTTTAIGLSRQKDASAEFRFITTDEKAVYDARIITFTGEAVYDETMGTVSVVDTTYELVNMSDNNQEHKDSVLFKAVNLPGYRFVGWSATADGEILSSDETYKVEVVFNGDVTVSNSVTTTLYAKFEAGVSATVLEQKITSLEWFTTYTIADLFCSNNPNPIIVTLNGDTITELTTSDESSLILRVSQEAIEGEFLAMESLDYTYTVAPAAPYPPVPAATERNQQLV